MTMPPRKMVVLHERAGYWLTDGEQVFASHIPSEAHATLFAQAKTMRDALLVLAHSFETGWAGDCESRHAVIARVEQMASAALGETNAQA